MDQLNHNAHEEALQSVNFAIDETGLTTRLRRMTGRIPLAVQTLALFHAMKDPRTSAIDRVIMLGAIGYVVSAVDAWPDFLGGFADDAGVVGLAIAKASRSLRPEHFEKAREFFALEEDDDDEDAYGVPV